MKGILTIVFFLYIALWKLSAQNLVPNASFEVMDNCPFPQPSFDCVLAWSQPSTENDPVNTPDIGFEGAVFFPPSSINAHDGNNYLNLECSTGNPEYAQALMTQPLQAGVTYCVSFYASVNDQSTTVAPSLGIYFSNGPIANSPFELDLVAHVQGPVEFDPTVWTLISGTYTAVGGEDYLVVAGFENIGDMPFPYMYVDDISVTAMPALVFEDFSLCDASSFELNATAVGATYQWSTGEISPVITVTDSGSYHVIRNFGVCAQEASSVIFACDVEVPIDTTDTIAIDSTSTIPTNSEIYPFYIPNAFTPDGDGVNDVFWVHGPSTSQYNFAVFNRWGDVVFSSTDIEDVWTGNTRLGSYFVQDGIYVYRLSATLATLEIIERTGHISIIR